MGCLIPGLLFVMITVPGLALGLFAPLFFLILLLLIVLIPRVLFGSGRS